MLSSKLYRETHQAIKILIYTTEIYDELLEYEPNDDDDWDKGSSRLRNEESKKIGYDINKSFSMDTTMCLKGRRLI